MNNLSLNETALSLLIGKLLGDGSITISKGRSPRFQYSHRAEDKDWVYYCYDRLNPHLSLSLPAYKKVEDSRISKGYSECYYVQSKKCRDITILESLWYKNRTKRIPCSLIHSFFNDESLAWWYQDDGHLVKEKYIVKKIILSTDNFNQTENLWLKKFLFNRYKLNFKLDGQNRLILYNQFDVHYFLHIVALYMHPSMLRKVHYRHNIITKASSIRTTIYLPSSILLKKPTKEINNIILVTEKLSKIIKTGTFYKKWFLEFSPYLSNPTERLPYQVVISEMNRKILEELKIITGLTFSEIITLCFYLNK